MAILLLVAESDSEEEEEDEEEEEEFDSEGEEGEDGEASSTSDRRYPSRSTRRTRNSAAGDKKRAGNTSSLPSASDPVRYKNPAPSVLTDLCERLIFRVQSGDERSQQQVVSQGEASPLRL